LSETPTHKPLIRFDWFRLSLACFFFLYVYVVAQSLIPLPDEPPRINFWGVFCIAGGMVIGIHMLTSSLRLFQVGTWLFLLIAHWQMGKKIKFLEMMLEPKAVEVVTQYAVGVVLLVMLTPHAFRTFHQKAASLKRNEQPLLVKRGVPF